MSIQGFRNKLVVPAGPPALNFSHPAMGGGKAGRFVGVPNPGGGFLDLLTGKVSVTTLGGGTTVTTPTNIPGMGLATHVPNIATQNTNIGFPSLIPGETSTSWCLAQICRCAGSVGGGLTSIYFSAGNTTPEVSMGIGPTATATGSGVSIGSITIPIGHPVFMVVGRPAANNTCTFLVRDLVTGQIFVTSAANNTTWVSTTANYSVCGLGTAAVAATPSDVGPSFIGVGFLTLNQMVNWAMDPFSLWWRDSKVVEITSLTGPPVATFTTWNPSDLLNTTLSGGNLTAAGTAAGGVRSVDRVRTGKYYWEYTWNTASNNSAVGISNSLAALATVGGSGVNAGVNNVTGAINVNGVAMSTGIGTISAGGVVCIAVDVDARLVWFRNGAAGNWNGSATANPATGVGGYSIAPIMSSAFSVYALASQNNTGTNITANFGTSAFTGTVPSGFNSGFPGGTTSILNEVVTQVAAEEWARITPPQMNVTQIAVEEWVSVNPYVPPASNGAALLMGL